MPPYSTLTIWQVRVFLAVTELQSITRAAKRLNLSQSGLSRAVHDLEARLGIRVFDRGGNGLSLTAAGKAFLPHAQRMVAGYTEIVQASHLQVRTQHIRLAISSALAPMLLPGLIGSLPTAEHPTGLTVHALECHQIPLAVADGAADLGICLQPIARELPSLEYTAVLRTSLGALVAGKLSLPAQIGSLADLSHLPFARLQDNMVVPKALKAADFEFAPYLSSTVICDSIAALFTSIAQGLCVTLVSGIDATHPGCEGVRFVALPHLLPPLEVCLVSNFPSSELHAKWRALLSSVIANANLLATHAN